MKERRKFRRESLAPYTEIFPEDGGEPLNGYPVDMSRGGLALEVDAPLPIDSAVTVCVHFDPVGSDESDPEEGEEDGDSPVEFVNAIIKRVSPLGDRHKVSVEFIGLNEADHPILNGVLSFIEG